jgi:DNA polymerase V
MGMQAAVGHLDADCFYVSAERVRDRFLEKKPVGVPGNPGACVIAKSYEPLSGSAPGPPKEERHLGSTGG